MGADDTDGTFPGGVYDNQKLPSGRLAYRNEALFVTRVQRIIDAQ